MSLPAQQSRIALDDLRLIAAVAEAGSLTGAAKRLRLNHASAWRRLGALEARLGVRLFDRDRRGYAATPAGEEAVAASRRVLGEMDGLERRLVGQDVRPSGIVRLTTTETMLDLLAPIVAELRASHPGIVVELSTTNAFLTLTRREADIALRPAAEAPEGLVARRLGTVATAPYAARAYLARHPGRDATELDWIAPDDSLSHLGSARWIDAHVAPERIVHRTGSLLGLAAMARAGIGVAALPCYLVDDDPELARIGEPVPDMVTNLWLLTHPDLRRTARIRVVLDAMVEGLSVARPRLAAS